MPTGRNIKEIIFLMNYPFINLFKKELKSTFKRKLHLNDSFKSLFKSIFLLNPPAKHSIILFSTKNQPKRFFYLNIFFICHEKYLYVLCNSTFPFFFLYFYLCISAIYLVYILSRQFYEKLTAVLKLLKTINTVLSIK